MPSVSDQPGGKKRREEGRKKQIQMLLLTTAALAAGLALIWLTKTVLELEGDAVFIALLLVPLIVYLIVSGHLERVTGAGWTLEFRELVTDVGQREAERAAYLGKLRQVLEKDTRKPTLIYADVDSLRKVTRDLYLDERNDKKRAGPKDRRREEDIRTEIIKCLELALTDAFYDAGVDSAKFDVFRMFEPDIAMIVRYVDARQADQIAKLGEKNFAESAQRNFGRACTATTSMLFVQYYSGKWAPEKLDEEAAKELEAAKNERKGQA